MVRPYFLACAADLVIFRECRSYFFYRLPSFSGHCIRAFSEFSIIIIIWFVWFTFRPTWCSKISEHRMGNYKKLILDARLGRREGQERTSGYTDCRTAAEYNEDEGKIRQMIPSLHPNGHIVADFFRMHKADQLRWSRIWVFVLFNWILWPNLWRQNRVFKLFGARL